MVTGYKCFDENLQCRNNFQYEVGKRYKHNGRIELCESGFHFCRKAKDVFNYYSFDIRNRVCEVVARGEVFDSDDKSVTDDIEIVRELTWNEVLEVVNLGKANSGLANSGDRNSGDWNSGDRNSGNWNSGNWNSGLFCSDTPKMRIFNKQTDIEFEDFFNDDKYENIRCLLYNYEFPLTYWLSFDDMTEEEKEEYKKYECQEGVLLKRDYKTACEIWWRSIPEELKKEFVEWEWFDATVFEEITGIKVN